MTDETDNAQAAMLPGEKRATGIVASVAMLRMFGLFALLPVLSLYAAELENATPLLVGLAVVIFLMTFVVPKITRILKDCGQPLPWMSEVLMVISDVTKNYWFLILMAAGVGLIALRAYKARLASKLEWARLERASDVPDATQEQIRDLEEQVQRLTERVDFTEKLIGSGGDRGKESG